jgi:hypothetical protein
VTSAHAALFAGLPAPVPGSLTLYVFGPGFGESQVVALPDGKWMVVDSCRHSGVNLPLELLRHLDVTAIDLLALTHPDLDHYRGLSELIASLPVRRLWRYPGFGTARDILVEIEKEGKDPDFRELLAAYDAMAPLMRAKGSIGREVGYDTIPWPHDAGGGYQVWCIAPGQPDLMHEKEWMAALYKRMKDGRMLTLAEKRRLMGKANALSLAMVIRWGRVGVLLGGDVEHDASNAARGWRGVIANLQEDENLRLIQGLRLVKTAHHGSQSAFSEDAWQHHATGGAVELAVITRFSRGANPPPHTDGLAPILRHARQLALTSEPADGWPLVTAGGWARVTHPSGPGGAACVAVTLGAAPPSTITLSAQAALFERGPIPATIPAP